MSDFQYFYLSMSSVTVDCDEAELDMRWELWSNRHDDSLSTGRRPYRTERIHWCNQGNLRKTISAIIMCLFLLFYLYNPPFSGLKSCVQSTHSHTEVFHEGEGEDDAHGDDDNEVVPIHEPVSTTRAQHTYYGLIKSTVDLFNKRQRVCDVSHVDPAGWWGEVTSLTSNWTPVPERPEWRAATRISRWTGSWTWLQVSKPKGRSQRKPPHSIQSTGWRSTCWWQKHLTSDVVHSYDDSC